MSIAGRMLSVHVGERDRSQGAFVADRVVDELAGAGVDAAVLLRGVEGFGAGHRLRSDRLLTLSEDLPVAALAIGDVAAIDTAAARIRDLPFAGLVTVDGPCLAADLAPTPAPGTAAKLSVFLGRGRRVDGLPAHEWLVGRLRDAGVDGASVLLGVDGVLAGIRRRAGFFAANADVPALVVAVGDGGRIGAGLQQLGRLPAGTVATIERVEVHKRAGGPLANATPQRGHGDALRRLTLYSSEQAQAAGRPVHVEAVRRLRDAGAAGATVLRGIWGFDGRHAPHGDSLRSLRRRVPTVTVVVDTPVRSQRWLAILDELTPERGLITGETVAGQSRPSGTS